MVRCLEGQTQQRFLAVKEGGDYTHGGDDRDGIARQRKKRAQGTLPGRETVGTTAAAAPAPSRGVTGVWNVATPAGKPQGTDTAVTALTGRAGGVSLVRPRHIDQYVHLLPEATQKRAAMYGELMREFDLSREKLRIVMEDPHASDMDREQWAKRVSKLDEQIGAIRKELDREWEKVAASGRVVVDELGMAHLVNPTPDPSPKERGERDR
jgi:hypothetical protein